MRIADAGIEEMQQFVDTLIVIPNQNLFRIANEKTTFADAFAMADDVLHSGVRGVTDLMVVPGLINLDFADIRSVMSEMGKAMMGTGESDGEERARLAAEAAISNPLLDDVSMKGARGVLINITGGPDMTLFEVDEAANRIGEEVDADANIIFGSALDPSLEGKIRVSVVATGIDIDVAARPRPVLKVYNDPIASQAMPTSTPTPMQMTPTAMDIPTGAPAATLMGDGAATALKMPEPMPEQEETPLQEGSLDIQEEPAQTDIVALVEKEEVAEATIQADVEPAKAAEMSVSELEASKASAVQADEPFIPPAPAEPAKATPAKTVATADPFREAEMLNAAPVPEKKRSPNIFQRMTGSSWPKKDAPVEPKKPDTSISRPEMPPTPSAPITPAKSEMPKAEMAEEVPETTVISSPAPEAITQPETVVAPPIAEKPVVEKSAIETQPRLRGVEPQERLPNSQSEEDLLEIPAFLRRQAN